MDPALLLAGKAIRIAPAAPVDEGTTATLASLEVPLNGMALTTP